MSILIKGMEMPKDGTYNIVYIYSDGRVSMPFWGKGMQIVSGITAVPVPPHGRLIDADELIAKQEEDAEIFMGSTNYGDKVRYDEAMNAVANIVNAPTVIPADKDGEA